MVLVWVVASCLGAIAEANDDLVLDCRPTYAMEDFRSVRSAFTLDTSSSYTYYLFDNADLFYYRVELSNNAPAPVSIVDIEGNEWPETLKIFLSRDGVDLPEDGLSIEVVNKTLLDTRYYREGKLLENVDFKRRKSGWASDPTVAYDDLREVVRDVDRLPSILTTYQRAGVELKITLSGGDPLPYGNYHVDFFNAETDERCVSRQLVVVRQPEHEIDVADDYIVRYRYHRAHGDVGAAEQELFLATNLLPNNIKIWSHQAAHAYEFNDLEGQVEAVERLANIFRSKSAKTIRPESLGILLSARDAAATSVELRQKLEQLRASQEQGQDANEPLEPGHKN